MSSGGFFGRGRLFGRSRLLGRFRLLCVLILFFLTAALLFLLLADGRLTGGLLGSTALLFLLTALGLQGETGLLGGVLLLSGGDLAHQLLFTGGEGGNLVRVNFLVCQNLLKDGLFLLGSLLQLGTLCLQLVTGLLLFGLLLLQLLLGGVHSKAGGLQVVHHVVVILHDVVDKVEAVQQFGEV